MRKDESGGGIDPTVEFFPTGTEPPDRCVVAGADDRGHEGVGEGAFAVVEGCAEGGCGAAGELDGAVSRGAGVAAAG